MVRGKGTAKTPVAGKCGMDGEQTAGGKPIRQLLFDVVIHQLA